MQKRELKKKKWAKPQLIVLVRGDRQEGVLQVCKGNVTGLYDIDYDSCSIGRCATCADTVVS